MGNSLKALIKIQIRNGIFAPISSLNTDILEYSTTANSLIMDISYAFSSSIYTNVASNSHVSEMQLFIGRFTLDVKINGKQVIVSPISNITKQFVTLSEMYSTMSPNFECVMNLTLSSSNVAMPKSINLDYSTIQARETIGNVNVYVGDNGQTKYYDTNLPIDVNVGTMSFNTGSGEYQLKIALSKTNGINTVVTDASNFPYYVSSSYSNNTITITCNRTSNGFLLANITSATTGVPYQLVPNPTFSGNAILINLNGTNLDNVTTNYTITITVMVVVV